MEFAQFAQCTRAGMDLHREDVAGLTIGLTALQRGNLAEGEVEPFGAGLRRADLRACSMESTNSSGTIANGRLGLIEDPQPLQALLD